MALGLLAAGCTCRDRCEIEPWDYKYVEIGIGARDFIPVPYGVPVAPEQVVDGQVPHFNVALRTYGMEGDDLHVQIEAFVGDQRYANAEFDDVHMRCVAYGREVAHLELELDPATLPPQILPPPDTGRRPVDTARRPVDTAWRPVDTGLQAWRADVRVRATVTEPSGAITAGEATWYVYR